MTSNQKNIFIYQASAGSGKTETLAREYVRLLLKSPDDYKHTVAITFTNEATKEMKERILSTLTKLAEESEPDLTQEFRLKTGINDIKSKAKSALGKILHDYSNFTVTTIDSFFSTVLRSFSKELKIPPGFKIEMDQEDAVEIVTHQLLDSVGENDSELTSYLENIIIQEIEQDKSWKIDVPIKNLSSEVFKDIFWELNDKHPLDENNKTDIKEFREILRKEVEKIENNLVNLAKDALRISGRNNLTIEDFKWKDKGVLSYFYKLTKKQNYPGCIIPNNYVIKAIGNKIEWHSKDSPKKEIIEKVYNEGLGEILEKITRYVESNQQFYYTALEVLKTIFILGIFKDILYYLKTYRKKNNILFIHDINNTIRKVILEDNSHFIYEKTGNRYKNFLIDEFQDTSTFQWQSLLPLLINSISEKNFLMLVGDVKQSIYRWRGGNIKLMAEKIYDDFKDYLTEIEVITLGDNHRSRKAIVDFNSKFFEHASRIIQDLVEAEEHRLLIEKTYQNLIQSSKEVGGYIRIEKIQKPDVEEDKSVKDVVYEKTKTFIEELVSDGYLLNDILILVRKNEESRELSTYLTSQGYKIFSTESLLLKNSARVKFILNIFRYLKEPTDRLAKAEAVFNFSLIDNLNINQQQITQEEIFNDSDSLFEEIIIKKLASSEKNLISHQDMNTYELAEHLIKIFLPLYQTDAYLIKFLDVILEFENDKSGSIINYLAWWENKKNNFSIAIPHAEDVIRIMTIHKAKGLQSKVVIIPFANWKLGVKSENKLWVNCEFNPFHKYPGYLVTTTKSLLNTFFREQYNDEVFLTYLDNLNTLYVAFTRPSERLYVLLPESRGTDRISKIIEDAILSAFGIDFNSDNKIFETGEKTFTRYASKEKTIKDLNLFNTADWHKNLTVKTDYLRYKKITDEKFSDKTDLGILIHDVLSAINRIEDIDDVLYDFKKKGNLPQKLLYELEKKIRDIFKDERVKNWFDAEWDIFSEREILIPDGNIIRPDRVIYKDEIAVVIDYKSGKEKSSHRKQLNEYGNILRQMGYKDIKKYLLYFSSWEDEYFKICEVV